MREGIAGSTQPAAGRKKSFFRCPLPAACCLLLPCLLLSACKSPSTANIQLRKDNQKLTDERDQLTRQHAADLASLQACEGKTGIRPAVSIDRLNQLFTVHDLSLGRLTGGYEPSASSFDSGLVVYAVPTDDQGDAIKSAGSFKVVAYDLDDPNHPLIGQWSFDLAQTRDLFYAHFSLYTYVLQLPWQKIPQHHNVTIHVDFTDELTGRKFQAQKIVKVNPPPPPGASPATAP